LSHPAAAVRRRSMRSAASIIPAGARRESLSIESCRASAESDSNRSLLRSSPPSPTIPLGDRRARASRDDFAMTAFARVESRLSALQRNRRRLARVETGTFASRSFRLSSGWRPVNTVKLSFFFLSCSIIPPWKTVVYLLLRSCSQYSTAFLLTKKKTLLNRLSIVGPFDGRSHWGRRGPA